MSSAGIERGAHAAQRRDEIGQPFEREVLAVQRDEHGVGGDQRVQRQQAERRRTVDDDESIAGAQRVDERAQPALAIGQRNELDFGAGKIAGGGDEVQMLERGRRG